MRLGGEAKTALADRVNDLVVVVSPRDSVRSAAVQPDDLFELGVVAEVVEIHPGSTDTSIVVRGLARCRLAPFASPLGGLRARLEVIQEDERGVDDPRRLMEEVRSLGLRIVHRMTSLPPNAVDMLRNIHDPGHLIDLIVANLDLPIKQKLLVLAEPSHAKRGALALPLLQQVLAKMPARPSEGARCTLHEASAQGTCLRCGAFVCHRRCAPKAGVCIACRKQDQPAADRTLPLYVFSIAIAMVVWAVPLEPTTEARLQLAVAGVAYVGAVIGFLSLRRMLAPVAFVSLFTFGMLANLIRATVITLGVLSRGAP